MECQVYKKRWFILLLYWVYTITGIMHWIEYSVIADVIVTYYSVSYTLVECSSMVFLLMYIPFSIPGSYILDKLGLRASVLIGATGICAGGWIKVLSVNPNRFWILMLGQFIIAIFQVTILPAPPKLAAVWFGPNEVTLACSIGIVAIQMAIGTGFIIPPLIVEHGSTENIGKGLQNLSYVFAIPVTLMIPLLYFFFDDAPPTPPSVAQLQIQENEKKPHNYMKNLRNLFKNISFMLFVLILGVNIGISSALSILLNQIILIYHPNASKDVGIIGLVMMFAAIVGSISAGFVISKFGKLKAVIWSAIVLSQISLISWFCLLNQAIIWVYICSFIFSFFVNSAFCAGLDLGVELTYPEPVGASIGLITMAYQAFGVIFTYLYSVLLDNVSVLSANLSMMLICLLVNCSLGFIKFNFKRDAVNKETVKNSTSI